MGTSTLSRHSPSVLRVSCERHFSNFIVAFDSVFIFLMASTLCDLLKENPSNITTDPFMISWMNTILPP